MAGGRSGQACVTIVSDNDVHPCENDAAAQTIVVIGGEMQSEWYTNSVIVWDPSTMEWRLGPSLNDKRTSLVVVVCGDKVYAIGRCGIGVLDTMESIQVSSLLEAMEHPRQDKTTVNGQGCNVNCHLHDTHLPHLLYTIAMLSFWVVSMACPKTCHQWILWIQHHYTTTTLENQH